MSTWWTGMEVIEQKTKLLMKKWMSNSVEIVDGVGSQRSIF